MIQFESLWGPDKQPEGGAQLQVLGLQYVPGCVSLCILNIVFHFIWREYEAR